MREHQAESMEAIWADQRAFNDAIRSQLEDVTKEEWNRYYHLALLREAGEALDTTSWKIHRGAPRPVDRQDQLEELVDVMKYWLSALELHGFTWAEVASEYWRKSAVVVQRYRQEVAEAPRDDARPVVAVDLDGVLADYVTGFVAHINAAMGTRYSAEQVTEYDVSAALGLSSAEDMGLKRTFRSLGGFATLPAFDGAAQFTTALQDAGYRVVLLTARPYWEHGRLYADTMEWLEAHQIPYDDLIFAEHKERELLDTYGAERVHALIDDMPENAVAVARADIPALLLRRPYNTDTTRHDNIYPVSDLPAAARMVTALGTRHPSLQRNAK